MTEKLSILIIEHERENVAFLSTELNSLKILGVVPRLIISSSLEEALIRIEHTHFNVIIVNLSLPDSHGIQTFLEVQKKAGSTPIIIFDGDAETEVVRDTIRLGAQDYLPKSDLEAELLARMIYHAIERSRLHEDLKSLSFTDELTGLFNRRGFISLVEKQMSLSKRMQQGFYLFLVDLDYFKQINDTFGHSTGDQALIQTAQCLRASLRNYDIVARLGGDEFAVVAVNTNPDQGDFLKNQLQDIFRQYNQKSEEPYKISISIGKTYYDTDTPHTYEDLIKTADLDLYQEKKSKHNLY